jgi:hypothetical protein
MQASGQAFLLVAISAGLSACFMRALYEIEEWRRRRHQRAELTREATRFVLRQAKAGR